MENFDKDAWLESTSMGFVDRQGRPIKNKDAEKMLRDADYRRVSKDEFIVAGEEVCVSTVFLGIRHPRSILSGDDVLYETMIFGGKCDQWQHRWENAAIASKAHQRIVEALKSGNTIPFGDTNIFTEFLNLMNED